MLRRELTWTALRDETAARMCAGLEDFLEVEIGVLDCWGAWVGVNGRGREMEGGDERSATVGEFVIIILSYPRFPPKELPSGLSE